MSSKKKTAKKGKGGKGAKGKGKKNEEIEELRTMLEALKKQIDSMSKTVKKQGKRITSLETDNKRMKKNIQKLQMNGGGGGDGLLVPTQSATPTTDIEQSDAESKDNDDSKLNEREEPKKKEEPKPKPVPRRNRPKPKRKAADIKFTFDMGHQKIKAVENGMAALKPKTYGGTIRFGRYCHFTKKNNDNLREYTITFDTRSVGNNSSIAFGFATNSFGDWMGSNFGQNNACIVKGNAQVLWTDKIYKFVDGKEYKHKQMCAELKSEENPKDGFFKEGQDVSVQIDLKNKIGRVWNETINKGGEDKGRVFEAILPDDYEICIVAYMGGSAKKRLTVKDQSFKFDEEETE